jgi:hypothetical protein
MLDPKNKNNQVSIRKQLARSIMDKLDVAAYSENRLGIKLYSEQVEMARAIVDPSIMRVAILCSRQFGKTETVSIAALFLADTRPGTKILLFAPTFNQAKISFQRIKEYAKNNKDKLFSQLEVCNLDGIEFANGSTIRVRSAKLDANIVGLTGDVIILDESQDINDFVVEKKIAPMLMATGGKLVKIGTPNIRNHFHASFEDVTYTKFVFDWTRAQNYLRKGRKVDIQGTSYPLELLQQQMPRAIKLEFFRDVLDKLTPEERKLVEYDSPEANEPSFRTEYMLEWVFDTRTFLSSAEMRLLSSGEFNILEKANHNERYFMGIDFARSERTGADSTVITVIRLNNDWTKEKVWCAELRGMDFVEQGQIIKHAYNLFKPEKICADCTGIGKPMTDILTIKEGLPLQPIGFAETDRISPKWKGEQRRPRYKTSMFDYARIEINAKRFAYPTLERVASISKKEVDIFAKGMDQWAQLMVRNPKNSLSLNKEIEAPPGQHDDHPVADVLAIFASLISTQFAEMSGTTAKRPRPSGVVHKSASAPRENVANQNGPIPFDFSQLPPDFF